jgi:hypothetical protein
MLLQSRACASNDKPSNRRAPWFAPLALPLVAAALATSGCRGESQSKNDPNAIYGNVNGKHTFIVAHLFDAKVYNDLGSEITMAREGRSLDESTLFTCFYELQLSDAELNQCAGSLGTDLSADNIADELTADEVWQLMVLRSDRVEPLTSNIMLRSELGERSERTMAPSPRLALTSDDPEAERWERARERARRSRACLADPSALDTSRNPDFTDEYRHDPTRAPNILDLAMLGYRTAKEVRAVQIAKRECASDYWDGYYGRNSRAASSVSRDKLLEAIAAVEEDNRDALLDLLDDEFQRDVDSLNSDRRDFDMSETLSHSTRSLSEEGFQSFRNGLIRASRSAETATRSVAQGRCIAPREFAKSVIAPSLDSLERQLGTETLRLEGCRNRTTRSRAAAARGYGTEDSEIKELRQRLAELQKELEATRAKIINGDPIDTEPATPRTDGTETRTDGAETVADVFRIFGNDVPSTCSASNANIANLSAAQLRERLESCRNLGASTLTDTFSRFSPSLREQCVKYSLATDTAVATCLCSCKWAKDFHDRLQSQLP